MDEKRTIEAGLYALSASSTTSLFTVKVVSETCQEWQDIVDLPGNYGRVIWICENARVTLEPSEEQQQEWNWQMKLLRCTAYNAAIAETRGLAGASTAVGDVGAGSSIEVPVGALLRSRSVVCFECGKFFKNQLGAASHFKDIHLKTAPSSTPAIEVKYDDEYLAIVVKPQGMETLGSANSLAKSDALGAALKPPSGNLLDALHKGRPVHRLDRPTGGLVVIGKTHSSIQRLCAMFREHRVKKRYRAICAGDMTSLEATGIGCSRPGASPLSAYITKKSEEGDYPIEGRINEPISGAPSVTHFRVVSVTPSIRWGSVTTVELWPESGRKHQLRRHLSERGHPILGDARYGGIIFKSQRHPDEMLCLWSLEVDMPHPFSSTLPNGLVERVHVSLDEPPVFQKVRDEERNGRPHIALAKAVKAEDEQELEQEQAAHNQKKQRT